jgi:guanylate kinase
MGTSCIGKEQSGKLILNSGLSGAGKSVLSTHAISQFPDLTYLKTLTTRERRDEESDSEYDFVDDDDYEAAKLGALSWDESIIHGLKYGNDPKFYIDQIQQGGNYLVNCYPSLSVVEPILEIYQDVPNAVLLIDVPKEVREERLRRDDNVQRIARLAIEYVESGYLELVDFKFQPLNNLVQDKIRYTNLIGRIIYGENYLLCHREREKI